MNETRPWHIKKLTSTAYHVLNRPRPQAETTIIVFEHGKYLGSFSTEAQIPLDAFKLARGHYQFWFVPTNRRPCTINTMIPSQQAGVSFSVTIDLHYKVEDAKHVALSNPDNLDIVVENEVRDLLTHLHHKHLPNAVPQIEQAIRGLLETYKHLPSGTILMTWSLTIRPDKMITQDGRQRYQDEMRVDQRSSRYTVNAHQTKLEHDLDMQRAEQQRQRKAAEWDEIDLVTRRVSIYLKQGQFEQLALLIANPGSLMIQQVVQRLEQQRDQNIDRQWQMFQQWLSSDDTDRLTANMGTFFQGKNQSPISGSQPQIPGESSNRQLDDDIDDDEIDRYIAETDMGDEETPYDKVEQLPSLTRAIDVDYPSAVLLNQRTSLTISLLQEPSAENQPILLIEDIPTNDLSLTYPQIDVVIRAPGFEIEYTNTQTLDVLRHEDTIVRFVLTPRKVGEQHIRIDFYQHQRRIGSVTQTTTVVAHGKLSSISTHTAVSVELLHQPAAPPDLEICVTIDSQDPLVLYFTLHSPIEKLDYHHRPVGMIRLQRPPLEILQGIYAELSRLAGISSGENSTRTAHQRRLERIGNHLWNELFPTELKNAYWRFQECVQSILITSDEPWIPWEMVKPYMFADIDQRVDASYLCETFILTRWLPGPGLAPKVDIERVSPIAPSATNLVSVQAELTHLARIGRYRAGVIVSEPHNDCNDVIELLERGQFNIAHIAAHGSFDSILFDNSGIFLSGGTIRPSDIRTRFGGQRPRPMIFINACHGARLTFSLTGLGGWADLFVRQARVAAFIGASWEVNDRLALLFAEKFYEALIRDGLTIGESMRHARMAVRDAEPWNSTWLAYVVYADPLARPHFPMAP